MNNLEKINIYFISIKTLQSIYNDDTQLINLGVMIGSKFILAKILYQTKKIIKIPYSIMVDQSTLLLERIPIVRYVIEEIIIKKYQLGQKNSTINSTITHLIVFINWLNSNNIKYFNNLNKAQEIFSNFTYYLKISMNHGVFSQGTAHSYQFSALKLLKHLFNDQENFIESSSNLIKNTRMYRAEKSLNNDLKYHFNFYHKFFHGISNFILQSKQYPYKLSLISNYIWILPNMSPYIHENTNNIPFAFNKNTGNIYTVEEIQKIHKMKKTDAILHFNSYQKSITKHNTAYYSYHRIRLANKAMKAYYMLFLTITGMNDSTATNLLWNDKYEVKDISHKFKTIKYRAGNKIVEFEIQNKFMSDFKKYLSLRKYILNGKVSPYLFFVSGTNYKNHTFKNKTGNFAFYINKEMIKHIDKNLPKINSRQLRVNKTHQVIKENGIIAASQLSQSSINTIISFYQGESFSSSTEQLTRYFKLLNKNIFENNLNSIETSIGHCNTPNKPNSKFNFANKKVDCSQQEGCLFCESYAVHIDKDDLKKIYSLEYIINESKYVAKDIEHYIAIYGPILKRIENIISEILSLKKISETHLKEIKDDVFINQNLHPYWEHKLKFLLDTGVLK